jgi:predicted GNAT family acetyltransferase
MGKRDLKKELADFDKKMLIGLISNLYDKNKSVKEYLDYFLKPDEQAMLKIYRTKVKEAFYPKRGFGFNLAAGEKAISDFRKLNPSIDSLINLMLHYVECRVQFTRDYGDIDENYYLSMEKTYRDSLELIDINMLHDKFKDKALKIFLNSENTGWGFNETLGDFYYETFPIEEN